MSTLFNIRIESVVGPTVRARFDVCHPDQWDVPVSKNIALQVVVEMFGDMKLGLGFTVGRQPFSMQEAADGIARHEQKARLEHWLELLNRDSASFLAEAEKAIIEVHLENEEGNPKQKENDPDPKATLVFTMTDASTLAHVATGFSFGSAMCDCRLWM